MTPNAKMIAQTSIPLPITTEALQIAQQYADEQLTSEKKEQIFLNTLAVCVVNDYMEMMDIPTQLTASDSWNAAMRLYTDVADLQLTGIGRLECRPVKSATLQQSEPPTCYIPLEVSEERIGMVVVEINHSDRAAILLGFVKTVKMGNLPISQLQPIDELLVHLENLQPKPAVNLNQWFENIFQVGWQSLEALIDPNLENLAMGVQWRKYSGDRATIKGAKLIDLGVQLGGQSVALLVAIAKEEDEKVAIRVQVHPAAGQIYLPPNLKLALLNEAGDILQEVPSRSLDNFIQLPIFKGSPGEQFAIEISLDNFRIQEDFII
jgi:Protein of unknown function (DUF1822)